MNSNAVLAIGIGEMGSVFTRGFLRCGRPVFPVTRKTAISSLAIEQTNPELVLISVAEKDIAQVLKDLPEFLHDRVILLQNELLPGDWRCHGYQNPTVISVWFEKKKGQDSKEIIPSPVYGPHANAVADALASLDLRCDILESEQSLLQELVLKNLYILTTNICGLQTGGSVKELWDKHRDLATDVANEVLSLQESLTGSTFDRGLLIDKMVNAFNGDPDHQCMGRSAPARLARALELAKQNQLDTPALLDINSKQ